MKKIKTFNLLIVLSVFFISLLLRVILLPNLGFEADISFWKSWGLAVFDHGIVWAAHNTNNNYPTPFAYLLGAMVWLYSLIANPHNFNEFWNNGNLLFLAIAKLPAILADFGIAALIIWLGKNAKRLGLPALSSSFYLLLALFYLFNPVSLIDGAWWGQVDSVGVFVFLLALIAVLGKRPSLAGILFMTAMMIKLQNMIYGPIFFIFLWQYLSYDGLVKGLIGSALAFFGLNIEFFLAHDMGRVVESLTVNFDYFPLMSLNAYNLWWIASGGAGMQISDKLLTLGLINAKTAGLLIFSSFYLFAVLKQFFLPTSIAKLTIENDQQAKNILRNFLESLIIVNAAFFLFQTQSHDRYAFPISVFLLLAAPFYLSELKKKNLFLFFTLYFLFSILYFYNLHTALVVNYPHNGLPWLTNLTAPYLTLGVAIVLITMFATLLVFIVSRSHPVVWLIPLTFLSLILVSLNLPLLTKKSVSLTKFTPFASKQDYGSRMTNMPVDAGFGIPKWSFMSVQYAFYRKGIGTHAASSISFDIGGHFRRFTTDYGIDTEAGPQGVAIFEIYGDDKLLFASDKIGRFDLPRHAEVNISGVKTLGLVTKPGGSTIIDDHTDWLNPLLWP